MYDVASATKVSTKETVVLPMNERQWELLCSIQDILGGILQNMDRDAYHAPAPWLLENLWHSIEAIKGMESN